MTELKKIQQSLDQLPPAIDTTVRLEDILGSLDGIQATLDNLPEAIGKAVSRTVSNALEEEQIKANPQVAPEDTPKVVAN